jgi:hypothetical protein
VLSVKALTVDFIMMGLLPHFWRMQQV